jgi:transcriptional regulator with XRE-family HTH domain
MIDYTDDIRHQVGHRVRELRVDKGFSQERLALESGLDRTYVNSVERGRRNISIVNIQRIAHALGVSTSEFFLSPLFADNNQDQHVN